MKTEQILMCIVFLILGMLLFHMLKGVCSCNTIEGQSDEEKYNRIYATLNGMYDKHITGAGKDDPLVSPEIINYMKNLENDPDININEFYKYMLRITKEKINHPIHPDHPHSEKIENLKDIISEIYIPAMIPDEDYPVEPFYNQIIEGFGWKDSLFVLTAMAPCVLSLEMPPVAVTCAGLSGAAAVTTVHEHNQR